MRFKLIHFLLILNLIFLAIVLLLKIKFIFTVIMVVNKALIVPICIAVLIYYIIRPIDKIFIKKNMSKDKAALLTLVIFIFVLSGLLYYFCTYAYKQIYEFGNVLTKLSGNNNVNAFINTYLDEKYIKASILSIAKVYVKDIGTIAKIVVSNFMNTFSGALLVLIIVYYLLYKGFSVKDRVIVYLKEENRQTVCKIFEDSDGILSHYVTGQAKVALSLALLIFIGYKIIGMPGAVTLSLITFILAFIPFVGFFIAMIIPIIMAISMGTYMFFKLICVFLVVQTVKGRLVVPFVMSKTMDIHPLTDIALVIIAVELLGPFAAFVVVPVYAILKNIILTFQNNKQT